MAGRGPATGRADPAPATHRIAAVVALALVLPVSFTAAALRQRSRARGRADGGRARRRGDAAGAARSTGRGRRSADEPPPAATAFEAPTTTVAERQPESISRRLATETTVRPFVAPVSPAPEPPADDPVVRSTTTVPPPQTIGNPVVATNPSTGATPQSPRRPLVRGHHDRLGGLGRRPPARLCRGGPADRCRALARPPSPSARPCGAPSSSRPTRATDCSVAMPASFRIVNVASGRRLGSVTSITEVPSPVRADGKMYTSTFAWDRGTARDRRAPQVPPALVPGGGPMDRRDGPYRGWGDVPDRRLMRPADGSGLVGALVADRWRPAPSSPVAADDGGGDAGDDLRLAADGPAPAEVAPAPAETTTHGTDGATGCPSRRCSPSDLAALPAPRPTSRSSGPPAGTRPVRAARAAPSWRHRRRPPWPPPPDHRRRRARQQRSR